MAAQPIGPQHGIEAARQRELELHPKFATAWNKRSDTFLQLVENSNDLLSRVAALEARQGDPFPFGGGSSTQPGA